LLTFAAAISVDTQNPNTKVVTVTGNSTFNATDGGVGGQEMKFIINNDATARTITFGTNFRSSGTLTGVASKASTICFVSDGTSWFETSRVVGTL
jgi:hypothetical protein